MATVTSSKRHLLVTSDTYTSNGDVVVGGDLTVSGSTTTLDTQNLIVEDKNIIIGQVGTPTDTTADGGGITLKGASDYTIAWNDSRNAWLFNQHLQPASDFSNDLGGSSYRWNSIYGGAGVFANSLTIGGNTAVTRTGVGNTGYIPVFSSNDNLVQSRIYQSSTGTYIHNSDSTTPLQITKSGTTFVKFIGESVINASQVEFPPGTESKPGLNFGRRNGTNANDNNTGIYSSAGDHVDIATGGSRRIGWDSAGTSLYTLSAATTDTDKFLVSDSGLIKYRTGSQIRSDIGAQASGNYETDDGSDDRYVFRVDLGNLSNVTRWYKVATVNIGNGGLLMRGSLTNHVESFGSTKFDLTIQGREANASDQIEITGSVDVFDDNTGVYIVKSSVSGSYTTYDVYIECYNYTQAWVELIKTGLTTFDTSGNYVTTSPSGLVELDTSAYSEGSYTIIDSENRFSIRKINANTTQISGNAPSSPVLRIGANNQNQIFMDGSTVTINDNMETEKIFINSIDNNTSSTTALVLNGTEVEKRTLGSRAFDSTSYLPLAGGTMSGSINMNGNGINMVNANLSNVNNITINDPGYQEGISWSGGSGWGIWESPDNMSNAGGSLQFSTGTTRQMTLDTSGVLETKSAQIVNNTTGSCVAHWSNSGSSTGAIKVTIPGTHSSNWSMLILRVAVYEYNGNEHTIFYVSGHDWTSGWYNNGVTKWGDSDKEISVAYDSNDDYIIIGDVTSTWSYGHVTVDVVAHPGFYHSAMDITSGWAISQVTSLSGITVQAVTNKLVADRAWVNAQGFLTSIPSHTHTWANIDSSKYATGTGNMISSAATGSPSQYAAIAFSDSGGVNKVALNALDLSLMDNSSSGFLTSGSTQSKYLRSDTNDTGTGIITLSQNNSTTPYPLIVKNVSNGNGVGIEFDDNLNGTQRGYITHFHSDSKSYGSGASIILGTTESTLTVLADGKLMYKEGIYSKPGSGTGAGSRKDNLWDEAYNNHITGIAVTGTSTKTITLTQKDGGTISANFTDDSGSAAEQDTLATVTGRGATTTTASTFDTITMNTPIVGSSSKIRFQNNDYIRFDDAANRFHFDVDGGTNNASVQAATFVGALSGNASTASSAAKWTTARTITLGGDLTGNVSIDGSANVTLNAQVVNNSHEHSKLYEESTITYGGSYLQWTDLSGTGGAGTNGNAPGNPFSDWHHHLIMNHGNSGGYYVDMAYSFHNDRVHFRRLENGSFGSWREFVHSGNIGSQSVSNADKVDNLHASDFLRSNANDSFTGDELHFPTLDLSISNNNSQNQGNTYFRGSGTHFVLGLNSGNTLYLNYGNSAGQFRAYGNAMYWNDNNIGTPWGSGNDGSGTGLDADLLDGHHADRFFRRIAKASANVGPGWMTVAENTSGRRAGEIIVTDADSGDHAYIRIEWMRSYADSHWTVLNTGGHSNRITGVRVMKDGDDTYGNKKLQVYCTVQSTYEVNIYEQGDIDDYTGHSVVTPVVQNSISGYSLEGNSYQNLDTYPFSVDQGIQGQILRSDSDIILSSSSGRFYWNNGYGDPGIESYYGSLNITGSSGAGVLYVGTGSGDDSGSVYAKIFEGGDSGSYVKINGNIDGTNFRDRDNTSYSLTPSSGSTGYWQVNTPSGYIQIGPQNTSYAHIQTDRARFYFNKEVQVDGGVIRSHNEDLQLGRAGTSDKIQIRSTNIGFFLDGAEDMRLENDGDLHVEGDVIAYSSTISDERLKDNVLTIDGALNKVCKLRGVEYTWNKGSRKDTRDLGVIAQEVEQVIPEIVREKKMPLIDDSEETYKTVDYEKLTAVLIEAVKELKAEVADLKQQINEK